MSTTFDTSTTDPTEIIDPTTNGAAGSGTRAQSATASTERLAAELAAIGDPTDERGATDRALVGIVEATRSAVETTPGAASVTFSTTGHATGAVATALLSRGHAWLVDEPGSLGGDDEALNPVEAALGAFLACQTVTYRFWAARLGIRLDDLQLDAEGDLDVRGFFGLEPGVRPGFSRVRVRVRPSGPETAERYAELARVVDEHCPVLDLFANTTPVETTLVTG
ncbi:OsmC family protein [Actinotalea sp. M2MS4P-6]|uniref:OsmC family protein n=1 Tax=Actinotalea sp. M2MS4P-6 TaxID=2983762 RepID=UPI0021E4D073|nr:OsmC family protein [Actinotalea sp. M2MS4P-6]MCV2396283.1 OsmC family protein [Actinotalea sp. M2MS4P-6]